MVLFHENDCHFNLVVDKNNDLATLGSLSRRLNVNLIANSNDDTKEVEVEIISNKNLDSEVSNHKKVQR